MAAWVQNMTRVHEVGALRVNETVKVVSLVGATERRAVFAAQNAQLDFQFVDAVDGRGLTAADLSASGLFEPDLRYTPGAYGNAMSMHRLWSDAAAGDAIVTIAEDDAIFRPDFHRVAGAVLRTHANEVDFVAWGYNFDSVVRFSMFNGKVPFCMSFDQNSLRLSIDDFLADRSPVLFFSLLEYFGICAYSISPQAAARLLAHCFPLKNDAYQSVGLRRCIPNYGIDAVMNRCYEGMRSFASFPPLAVTKNEHASSSIQRSA